MINTLKSNALKALKLTEGKEDKLGIRASSTCEVNLVDCRVHKSAIVGEVGKGYKIAIESLNEGRIGIGTKKKKKLCFYSLI